MKTISTLFTSLFFSAVVFASGARHSSMITVKSISYRDIQVVIDGKTFNPGKNIVMVGDVNPGYHSVAVYRESRFFNRDMEQVYSGSIAVKPGTDVEITIGRHGRADIAYQRKDSRDDEWAYERPVTPNPHSDNDYGRWEDNKSYSSYASPISDREFNQVMSSMQKEWFENNRMKSASYIISNNFFTADQVKDMISLFDSEANKLEIAKQAYANTVDKENYRCVMNALDYKSSKEELARFIRTCGE
ncbi:MAG: DUF4476 domain-containing protein [Bacteroidetes bacterium]|nr:DUF4476 domain-containing protein [Bacteroidota bacterium]